jgi:hypothetical protein
METLDQEEVVLTWLMRGIEDLFMSFKIDSSFSRYSAFLNAMGFEMICKAFLLTTKNDKYEGVEINQAIRKIDKLARNMGHKVSKLVEQIKAMIGDGKIQPLLDRSYDSFTGSQFLEVIESAYLECRYPVPNPIHEKFPIDGKDQMFWDPLFSSGLHKFCYAFCRELLTVLKNDFSITISKSRLEERVTGKEGERFCNLLFGDNINDYISG